MHLKRSAQVPYTPKQMYDLVNDIQSYPNFLPWCSNTEIVEQNDESMIATIEISAKGLKQSFTTRNYLKPHESIEMHHLDGPFGQLKGVWTFQPSSDDQNGCDIYLDLAFEVSGGLKAKLFGMVFNKAADKLVSSFTQRAHEIYGQQQSEQQQEQSSTTSESSSDAPQSPQGETTNASSAQEEDTSQDQNKDESSDSSNRSSS